MFPVAVVHNLTREDKDAGLTPRNYLIGDVFQGYLQEKFQLKYLCNIPNISMP